MQVFLYLVPYLLKTVSVQILQMRRVAEELQTICCDIYMKSIQVVTIQTYIQKVASSNLDWDTSHLTCYGVFLCFCIQIPE